MGGNIYLIRGGELVGMREQPYNSEQMLQSLLAEHPALLAGEQMTDAGPRQWLLVSREMPLSVEPGASSWYVDHLYLDQDGVPTLVEVKRSTDTRIRREVIGQMLDYAANAMVRWSSEEIRARLESETDGADRLSQFLEGGDSESFWESVRVNLASGRIRMVFVADVIPPELRRVVDFLAAQLQMAEVFAVEVRNYQGAGERALVPRLVSVPKSTPGTRGAERQWDEATFFDALRGNSKTKADVARVLVEWSKRNMTDFFYGKGSTAGSCLPRLLLPEGKLLTFAIWTSGQVQMLFQWMTLPPFDDEERCRDMLVRLNRIPGVSLPLSATRRRPSFDLLALSDPEAMRQFLETMEWTIQQVRQAGSH